MKHLPVPTKVCQWLPLVKIPSEEIFEIEFETSRSVLQPWTISIVKNWLNLPHFYIKLSTFPEKLLRKRNTEKFGRDVEIFNYLFRDSDNIYSDSGKQNICIFILSSSGNFFRPLIPHQIHIRFDQFNNKLKFSILLGYGY